MEVEDAWIKYSDMDTSKYTGLITAFSTVTSLFTHPLNVVTTRQQAAVASPSLADGINSGSISANNNTSSSGSSKRDNNSSSSKSVGRALQQNYHDIGLRGLFRGWTVITAMGLPSQVMYLHSTELSREYLQRKLKAPEDASSDGMFTLRHQAAIDIVQTTLSSILANLISNIPYVPAEVISNRMIVQGRDGLGTTAMIKKIWVDDGFKGFYRGFGASLSLGIMYSAQWWFCYSTYRRDIAQYKFMQDNPILFDASAGLVAGQLTTTALHPLDTIKTLIMTDPSNVKRSIFQRATGVIKERGVASLWRGLGASLYHSAFSCTGFAIIYEVIKRFSVENQGKKRT
jgi:hypothetical protein